MTCPECGRTMRWTGRTSGEDGTYDTYQCQAGHTKKVKVT